MSKQYEAPKERIDPTQYGLPKNIEDEIFVPDHTILVIPEQPAYTHMAGQLIEPLRGHKQRGWFVQHAYFCLPLLMANEYGFVVRAHYTFEVLWNGGNKAEDVVCKHILSEEEKRNHADRAQVISSHFGMGTVTVQNRWVYRTPKGVNLMTINPPNLFIDGIHHMSGIIETDNLRRDFTFNLKITRPNCRIRIPKGTPIGCIIPYPRNYIDQFQMRIADETMLPPETIQNEQNAFKLHGLERAEIDAKNPGGVGLRYMRGEDVFGNPFEDHQRMLSKPAKAKEAFIRNQERQQREQAKYEKYQQQIGNNEAKTEE